MGSQQSCILFQNVSVQNEFRITVLKKLYHQFMGEQEGHVHHFWICFWGIPARNFAPIQLGPVMLFQELPFEAPAGILLKVLRKSPKMAQNLQACAHLSALPFNLSLASAAIRRPDSSPCFCSIRLTADALVFDKLVSSNFDVGLPQVLQGLGTQV